MPQRKALFSAPLENRKKKRSNTASYLWFKNFHPKNFKPASGSGRFTIDVARSSRQEESGFPKNGKPRRRKQCHEKREFFAANSNQERIQLPRK
jgi:hypothetical protein